MFNYNNQDGINPPGPVYEWLTAVAAVTQRARRAEVTILSCMLKKWVLWDLLRPIGKQSQSFICPIVTKGRGHHSRAFHEL